MQKTGQVRYVTGVVQVSVFTECEYAEWEVDRQAFFSSLSILTTFISFHRATKVGSNRIKSLPLSVTLSSLQRQLNYLERFFFKKKKKNGKWQACVHMFRGYSASFTH